MAHPGPKVDHRTIRSEALKKGVDAKNIPVDVPPEQGAPKGMVKGQYKDAAAPSGEK
jgi:hypothetical protein